MKGAIYYSSKYGSTGQYAKWISEATGLPVYNMKKSTTDPSQFDFLILGSPIIYYKVYGFNWVKKNLEKIMNKPILFFTVSGAPKGAKLDQWMSDSLPASFLRKLIHVALGGRQNPKELTFYDRMMLIIASWMNSDPKASKEELHGFDFMDKSSIEPIVAFIKKMKAEEVPVAQGW